jgi:hypothetical protein
MNHWKRYVTGLLIAVFCLPGLLAAQNDQASLLLDLKAAKAAYEIARQKHESDTMLFENKAISEDDFNASKNTLITSEVKYQKLILQVMSQQSYIIVERAVKYQSDTGERRVKVTLRSTMEGNQEYLNQFQEHFDVFTPEMRSGKIYNVFVSLLHIENKTIIGTPYEIRVPTLDLGKTSVVDFGLLRDVESLQVSLNYSGKKAEKNIYLEKDVTANRVDINSVQFSQEANLGDEASFDLTLERFAAEDDIYQLVVVNLPRQVTYEFLDTESNTKLSTVKFTQGVNTKKLSLQTFLPDRDDDQVALNTPLVFYALVIPRDQYGDIKSQLSGMLSQRDIDAIPAGKVRLELIPRGVGSIEVRAPTLYHEITVDDQVSMEIVVQNNGTRRLDNIRVSIDEPLHWRSEVQPELIRTLDPEQEARIQITITPPEDAGVGAQEVKIRTEAMAENTMVESEDKTVRIQLRAQAQVFGTVALILLLFGVVIGIVVFGIKITRR